MSYCHTEADHLLLPFPWVADSQPSSSHFSPHSAQSCSQDQAHTGCLADAVSHVLWPEIVKIANYELIFNYIVYPHVKVDGY